MEDYEFYSVIEKANTPQIEDLIQEEIFIDRFCAETAKKVLSVSNHYHVNKNDLLEKVENWINRIESKVAENEKIR